MQHGITFGRGVWVAPFLGPNGEMVLVAVNRDKRQVGPLAYVPTGGNHVAIGDELCRRLDGDDPMPNLKIV